MAEKEKTEATGPDEIQSAMETVRAERAARRDSPALLKADESARSGEALWVEEARRGARPVETAAQREETRLRVERLAAMVQEGAFDVEEASRYRRARMPQFRLPQVRMPQVRMPHVPMPRFLRRGHPVRSLPVLSMALAGVIVGVIVGTLSGRDLAPERRPAPEGRPSPEVRETAGGIVVPEVAGLTAWEARDVLVTVDLRLARIVPVRGEPGVVEGTRPATGEVVGPSEAVTLLVGVEPDRLGPEE
jgi:hypothetical protein